MRAVAQQKSTSPLWQTLRDGLGYVPSQLLPRVLSLISVPIYTRLFSPSEYGIIAVVGTAVVFLMTGVDWVRESAFRFHPAYQARGRAVAFFRMVVLTTMLSAAVALPLIGTILYGIADMQELAVEHVFLTIGIFLGEAFLRSGQTLLRAERKVKLFTMFDSTAQIVRILLGLALVVFWRSSAVSVLWGWFFTLAVLVPLMYRRVRPKSIGEARDSGRLGWGDVKEFCIYGLPFTGNIVNTAVLTTLDRLMLKTYWSDTEVGVYSLSSSLTGMGFAVLFSVIGFASYPIVVKTWEQDGKQATEHLLAGMLRLFFVGALPITAGIIAVAIPAIQVLATPEYVPSRLLVVFLVVQALFQGLLPITTKPFALTKQSLYFMVTAWAGSFLALGLSMALVPVYSMEGAALAMAISNAAMVFGTACIATKMLHFAFALPWRTLVVCATGSVILGVSVESFLAWSGVTMTSLVVSVVGGVTLYTLLLGITGELKRSLRVPGRN